MRVSKGGSNKPWGISRPPNHKIYVTPCYDGYKMFQKTKGACQILNFWIQGDDIVIKYVEQNIMLQSKVMAAEIRGTDFCDTLYSSYMYSHLKTSFCSDVFFNNTLAKASPPSERRKFSDKFWEWDKSFTIEMVLGKPYQYNNNNKYIIA